MDKKDIRVYIIVCDSTALTSSIHFIGIDASLCLDELPLWIISTYRVTRNPLGYTLSIRESYV